MNEFKTVKLQGIDIAYREVGKGRPVIMLHGIASFSYSWKYLIEKLPGEYRFLMLDFKGMGYSSKDDLERLSAFDQSEVVRDFIIHFKLKDVVLVGHSMGGLIGLLSVFDPGTAAAVSDLIIIDSAGMFLKIPDFVSDFLSGAEDAVIIKYSEPMPDVLPRFILNEFYYDAAKIKEDLVAECAKVFALPNAKKSMITALRQMIISNFADFYSRLQNLKIRTLIIWGENDTVIDVEDALHFKNAIPKSTLTIIPECGHSPHEEKTEETAKAIESFLAKTPFDKEIQKKMETVVMEKVAAVKNEGFSFSHMRHTKMSRLFKGNWNLPGVMFFIVIKTLQFFRRLGVFAKTNGWRQVTRIFLRKEHSKFCLASLRLDYLDSEDKENIKFKKAKLLVVAKLFKFIKNNSVFHWSIVPHSFSVEKKPHSFVDIIVADFDDRGKMLHVDPHFETNKEEGLYLTVSKSDRLAEIFVDAYNESLEIDDKSRLKALTKKVNRAIMDRFDQVSDQITARHYGMRILQGTFIYFKRTSKENKKYLSRERLATPDLKKIKHPGAGLLNVICRFSPDLYEVDLWFQYHHVPVDGMPMQEMLEKLKEQWGSAGPVVFPPIKNPDSAPEIMYAGDKVFRGRVFCDFSKIMKLRKELNKEFYNQMMGPAPLPALLMWGISQHKDFSGYKFTMPVDTALLDSKKDERNISLIFIRPKDFKDDSKDYSGLVDFIREFNYQIYLTRIGKSESYEFIELAGMLHPLIMSMIKKIFPNTFSSVIGNAGLTIIKNAEVFITPLTELQRSGFIAIGNCRMPTSDGGFSGVISICGDKKLVRAYVNTLNEITENFDEYVK